MNRAIFAGKVAIQHIRVERSKWSHEKSHSTQTSVKCLVSGKFIFGHFAAPETLAVKSHIPIREVIAYKLPYGTSGACGFIIIKRFSHILHEGVEQRQNPTVNLRSIFNRHLRQFRIKSIYIGIESKESVGVIKCGEELS